MDNATGGKSLHVHPIIDGMYCELFKSEIQALNNAVLLCKQLVCFLW